MNNLQIFKNEEFGYFLPEEKAGCDEMWIVNFLKKKRQHSEEMYQRYLSGIIGLIISTISTIIAIILSFK